MSVCDKIKNCSASFTDRNKNVTDPKGKSKSSYRIENNRTIEYSLINFDGCVFDDQETKCDYGMVVNNLVHYIELKGSDANKGLRQLYSTIISTKQCYTDHVKKARLILSNSKELSPRFRDENTIKKLTLELGDVRNGKKGNFITTNNQFTEKIS